jgi:hypothetical protein
MVQKFTLLLLTTIIFSCIYAQTKSGKLEIDKNLQHHLFSFLPYGTKVYYPEDTSIHFISNADIVDLNNNRVRIFDTCRSYFSTDTLVIEYKEIGSFRNGKLILKIKKKIYWVYLADEEGLKTKETVIPQQLTFKKKIKKKGDEIFGELKVEFYSKMAKHTFFLNGPFRCFIEK